MFLVITHLMMEIGGIPGSDPLRNPVAIESRKDDHTSYIDIL